ncbi:MAG: methyltransferase domain-containing protein [Patescibacteria group bacterium]
MNAGDLARGRRTWSIKSHEHAVEQFYGAGIQHYHNFNRGHLGFGYDLVGCPDADYLERAENLVRQIVDPLGLTSSSKLLSIGFGNGAPECQVYWEYRPARLIGYDVTYVHVKRARERAQRQRIPETRVAFNHGTGTHLPLQDHSMTHAMSIEVPEHINTREEFLREMYRVLAPSGRISFSDFALMRDPRGTLEQWAVNFGAKVWQVPRANIYGPDTLRAIMEQIGFCNIEIRYVGEYVIPGYYRNHRRLEMMIGAARVRGFWKGIVGGYIIDRAVYSIFKAGLCEYIIVTADKPSGARAA